MKDILTQIVADKLVELEASKKSLPAEKLREMALSAPSSSRSMKDALAGSASGIIAEFKRKSPSRGWIHENASPSSVVPSYEKAGASAVSILTDSRYFGGNMDFIREVRPLVNIPILRKDFIVDEYQLLEARLIGADAVLLIAACLEKDKCSELLEKAHSLGLQVLLETHSPSELEYITSDVDMVGVNNRNLGTFHTDVRNSFRMAEALKAAANERSREMPVLVSESGISSPETVRSLKAVGFGGFLMGENFMKTEDPAETLRNFISDLG